MESSLLASPIIQYGFAGFCVLLLTIIVWLINNLLKILKDVTDALNKNTSTIDILHENDKDIKKIITEVKDCLYKRPCISTKD